MIDSAKTVMIVAGEASADRYGSRLVQALRTLPGHGDLRFIGTGGDRMAAEGVELLGHIRDLAHIGPREAIAHLRVYLRVFSRLRQLARELKPSVAVLLDFPDFNLRLAKKLRKEGIPVIYYISPQLWAWRRGRVRIVQRYVNRMMVILPFEEEFYKGFGVNVEFVGHPILEEFSPDYDRAGFLKRIGLDPARRTLAVLPGSRKKEIDYLLPDFLRAARLVRERTGSQCVVSVSPTIDGAHMRAVAGEILKREELEGNDYRFISADSRDILANSDFGLVKSGTSTLEAALVGTPFLIAYKLSHASWLVGSKLVRTPFTGLVNLIAGCEVAPEFIQQDASPEALSEVVVQYWSNPEKLDAMKARLAGIRELLGSRCASERVAAAVGSYL
jgi:lipid-A-disaccharide synthase